MTWFRNDPPLVLERTQGLGERSSSRSGGNTLKSSITASF